MSVSLSDIMKICFPERQNISNMHSENGCEMQLASLRLIYPLNGTVNVTSYRYLAKLHMLLKMCLLLFGVGLNFNFWI